MRDLQQMCVILYLVSRYMQPEGLRQRLRRCWRNGGEFYIDHFPRHPNRPGPHSGAPNHQKERTKKTAPRKGSHHKRKHILSAWCARSPPLHPSLPRRQCELRPSFGPLASIAESPEAAFIGGAPAPLPRLVGAHKSGMGAVFLSLVAANVAWCPVGNRPNVLLRAVVRGAAFFRLNLLPLFSPLPGGRAGLSSVHPWISLCTCGCMVGDIYSRKKSDIHFAES